MSYRNYSKKFVFFDNRIHYILLNIQLNWHISYIENVIIHVVFCILLPLRMHFFFTNLLRYRNIKATEILFISFYQILNTCYLLSTYKEYSWKDIITLIEKKCDCFDFRNMLGCKSFSFLKRLISSSCSTFWELIYHLHYLIIYSTQFKVDFFKRIVEEKSAVFKQISFTFTKFKQL